MVYAFCIEIPSWNEFINETEAFIYIIVEFNYGLVPYLEPTVILVPKMIRELIEQISDSIGFDEQTVYYLVGLFLCYPMGIIMNQLPYGTIRHIISFLFGVFLLQLVLNVQWIHHCITCTIVYLYLYLLPYKWSTVVVPIFLFGYLVMGHIHRQYTNYLGYDLDFTVTQMVLTQKLYMLAYNLYDGEVLLSLQQQDGSNSGTENNNHIRATKKCQEYALYELPSIIQYLGYTFCFSNLLAGPAYEFSMYTKTCDGSLLYTENGQPRGKIPSNFGPTLRPFLVSLGSLFVYLVGNKHFPLLDPKQPEYATPVILTDHFLKKPWIYRYAYLWIGFLVMRFKYYFVWKNAEAANNLWYAGFEGFDRKTGEVKGWENCTNLYIMKVETAQNLQSLTKEWNRKTSLWLTKYVYIRTNGSLFAVYTLAALWHGLYPGYYLFFLSVPLVTICERIGRKKITPQYISLKYYGNVCTFGTFFVMVYMTSPFALLSFSRSWENWKHHYFFGHIGCILFYMYAYQLPNNPKSTEQHLSSTILSKESSSLSSPSHKQQNPGSDVTNYDEEIRPFLLNEDKIL